MALPRAWWRSPRRGAARRQRRRGLPACQGSLGRPEQGDAHGIGLADCVPCPGRLQPCLSCRRAGRRPTSGPAARRPDSLARITSQSNVSLCASWSGPRTSSLAASARRSESRPDALASIAAPPGGLGQGRHIGTYPGGGDKQRPGVARTGLHVEGAKRVLRDGQRVAEPALAVASSTRAACLAGGTGRVGDAGEQVGRGPPHSLAAARSPRATAIRPAR